LVIGGIAAGEALVEQAVDWFGGGLRWGDFMQGFTKDF
jgi:hypothetical protein